MSAPELKPCPFCGSKHVGMWKPGSCIVCHDCGAEGPAIESSSIPISDTKAAWNRRADLPPTDAQIAAHQKVRALVEAATQLRERFETSKRGRTWTMTDMQSAAAVDAALAAFKKGKP